MPDTIINISIHSKISRFNLGYSIESFYSVYFSTISSSLLMYTFFDAAFACWLILDFRVLMNFSATIFLQFVLNTLQCHCHATTTSVAYCKTRYPDLPIFCSVWTKTIQNFLNYTGDCNTFIVFQWNNPGLFTKNINNIKQESDPVIVFGY